jgi:hypothetical protein
MHIHTLGAQAVVQVPNSLLDLIEQALRRERLAIPP